MKPMMHPMESVMRSPNVTVNLFSRINLPSPTVSVMTLVENVESIELSRIEIMNEIGVKLKIGLMVFLFLNSNVMCFSVPYS